MASGGPKMLGLGFDAWHPLEKLAVRGYVEVLRHYREIAGIRADLKRRLLADPPDVFIGVDAPDFNLGLEKALKQRGIATIHYVSPSIWAWRGGRIHKIGAAVSRVLALFPFEPELYEKQGIPVSYVGHPLADMLPLEDGRESVRTLLGLLHCAAVFALLPGSRQSELQYMADTFIETARGSTPRSRMRFFSCRWRLARRACCSKPRCIAARHRICRFACCSGMRIRR
jgi:lipid-A-disaccharide synthase